MYLGINENNFTRFGLDTEETRTRIKTIIINEYKADVTKKQPDMTIGQLIRCVKHLSNVLDKMTLKQLLMNSKEDASQIVKTNLIQEIIDPLIKSSATLEDFFNSSPMLSTDEYWDDWCIVWETIGKALGGKRNPYGDYEYDELAFFTRDFDSIRLLLVKNLSHLISDNEYLLLTKNFTKPF